MSSQIGNSMSAQVNLIGNLTKDPELMVFDSGKTKVSFSVAVNRRWNDESGEKKEQVSYFDVIAWAYTADDIARILSKGNAVIINGRLEQQSWDDKTTGEKRSKVVVIADNIALALRNIESYERRQMGEGKTSIPDQKTSTSSRPANRPQMKRVETQEEPF
jgi:single stranded DNA-binding protein